MRYSGVFAFALISAALAQHQAEAEPIIFTDRAAFEKAAQPNLHVSFDTFQTWAEVAGGGPFDRYCPGHTGYVGCLGRVDGVLDVGVYTFGAEPEPVGSFDFPMFEAASFGFVGGPMTAVGFDVTATNTFLLQWLGVGWYTGDRRRRVDPGSRLARRRTSR
jgi:hypothetical protein